MPPCPFPLPPLSYGQGAVLCVRIYVYVYVCVYICIYSMPKLLDLWERKRKYLKQDDASI